MNQDVTSPEARAAYQEVVDRLVAEHGAVDGRMFGMPCVKRNGKAIGGLSGDATVFKLPPDSVERALAIPGARLFDPMGGRPMKQWVQVPLAAREEWPALALAALPGDDKVTR